VPISKDIADYKEGDQCIELNKQVKMLIMATPSFIVFLDEDLFVQWLTEVECDTTGEAGLILNRVSYLETISTTHFAGLPSNNSDLAEFRRLLGESVARAFDGNPGSANALLDRTEELLLERSVQRARQWYLTAATVTAILPVIGVITFWLLRGLLRNSLGHNGFEVAICACLGGIGSLVFIILGARRVTLNAAYGSLTHYMEGAARVIVGVIGATLTVFAVKGNLLLGNVNAISDDKIRLACLCSLAIIAGASERFVPNLIKKIETPSGELKSSSNNSSLKKAP
jgi:hypothetical protein